MQKVTASEFARNFGRWRDAAQREPVAVTHHERTTAVLISPEAFAEYERLGRLATRALYVEELSAESVAAIENAQMDPRHADLDRLMD
jgi:PHD/YefM family antitoxin component YafN of YafNO toxin-antitoxin module